VELVTILAIAVIVSGRSVSAGLAVIPVAEMTVTATIQLLLMVIKESCTAGEDGSCPAAAQHAQ